MQPLHGLELNDQHRRRVELVLLFSGGMVVTLGGAWGTYYLLHAKWMLMAMDFALVTVGLVSIGCTLKHHLRPAALLASHGLLVGITAFCFFDVPVPGVARSVHMHLLSLAAASFMLFRGERLYLRQGLPLTSLCICLVFAGSHIGITDTALLPPIEVRAISVWINNATCFITLAVVMVIMQADVAARNAIETDMREALAQGHFLLHYQPQVGEDGGVIGAEALLRWSHPKRGLIAPGKFIPLAEETGLIVPIGDWVLRMACAQLVAWAADPRTACLTLAVNVSPSQFRQPDFVEQVLDIVKRSGARPSRLKLELTESMLAKDLDEVIRKMAVLKAHGLSLSLDDFGTGYSSLTYLKRLPLDQLKIDQSFVRDLLTDPNDMAIVRTLVSLGNSLGLMLIAEGVETSGQHLWLKENGCPACQGYLFGKPMPIEQFAAWMDTCGAATAGGSPILETSTSHEA